MQAKLNTGALQGQAGKSLLVWSLSLQLQDCKSGPDIPGNVEIIVFNSQHNTYWLMQSPITQSSQIHENAHITVAWSSSMDTCTIKQAMYIKQQVGWLT